MVKMCPVLNGSNINPLSFHSSHTSTTHHWHTVVKRWRWQTYIQYFTFCIGQIKWSLFLFGIQLIGWNPLNSTKNHYNYFWFYWPCWWEGLAAPTSIIHLSWTNTALLLVLWKNKTKNSGIDDQIVRQGSVTGTGAFFRLLDKQFNKYQKQNQVIIAIVEQSKEQK